MWSAATKICAQTSGSILPLLWSAGQNPGKNQASSLLKGFPISFEMQTIEKAEELVEMAS